MKPHDWQPSPHTFAGHQVRVCAACGVNEVSCEDEECHCEPTASHSESLVGGQREKERSR